MPSENPMSNSIPSDITPRIFRGSRLTTNSACLPSISLGFSRSFFSAATITRCRSPKFTFSATSLSAPGTSSTASIADADIHLIEQIHCDAWLGGGHIHVHQDTFNSPVRRESAA
jgi:hypothetical protein